MKPFVAHVGLACPLALTNVDTDQLIPGRFLKLKRGADLGRVLLHDLRFSDGVEVDAFPLNQGPWRAASLLVARRNFGCGSSREAAVYALEEFGIRAVLAPSFGDIFSANAVKNGLLPVVLPEPVIDELLRTLQATPELAVAVDLVGLTVSWGNRVEPFALDAAWQEQLLHGWDDLDVTRARAAEIADFKARDAAARPWAVVLPRSG